VAAVVIMIGRKRNRQARGWRRSRHVWSRSRNREVDQHDAVFLHDADQKNDSMMPITDSHIAELQRQQCADAGDGSVERIVSGWM